MAVDKFFATNKGKQAMLEAEANGGVDEALFKKLIESGDLVPLDSVPKGDQNTFKMTFTKLAD